MRLVRPAGVLLSAAMVAACTSSRASDSGSTPGRALEGRPLAACTISGQVPVVAQAAALCGTLTVPEDPSKPNGRSIDLRVAVVPAVASTPAPDPLFVLAGGPGDASTQFFAWLPGFYADVHAKRDIVLVDQRGTGASNPLSMPAMPDASGLSAGQADEQIAAWARDGLAALDADSRMYTSTIAADDLDAVRAALGYDRIDLYGTSYGGELAQYYLRQHPDHVRVAIMDGTTPLDVPVLELMAANSEAAMDLLLSRCAADEACGAAFPDLAAEWSGLVASLAAGITITNPDTGEQGIAGLSTVGPSIHNALLTEGAAINLPLAVHLASQGQFDAATPLVPPVNASPSIGSTLLMRDEILCSEAWARWEPDEVARLGGDSYAVPFVVDWAVSQAALCSHLPAGVVPANDGAPVTTDIPILWLAGDGDPQDPPANLARVESQAPNSIVVVMPAQEHVVGHVGCGPSIIAAFLESGSSTGVDISCATSRSAPAQPFRLSE